MKVLDIDYNKIPHFSSKDLSYINDNSKYLEFIQYESEFDEFEKVLKQREAFDIDRTLLNQVVSRQYAGKQSGKQTLKNIESLLQKNCFTITTAHQPSFLSGPLYFIFKALSCINLVSKLSKEFPNKSFVPVFVLGAEDHDYEEINHTYLYNKKVEWNTDQTGAVGRFSTDGIKEGLDAAKEILGENHFSSTFIEELKSSLSAAKDYANFSFNLAHKLFDDFGMLIVRMDDKAFKRNLIPIIKEELLNQPSFPLVTESQRKLKESLGQEAQAYVREANFFYLHNEKRTRIVKQEGSYQILDTDLSFNEEELIQEIELNPDRFSPNVITRPLYQSLILPDLAYIGGGGEIAYWLERKSQFQHFKLHFPMLIRRNSAMLVTVGQQKQLTKLDIDIYNLLEPDNVLINLVLSKQGQDDYSLQEQKDKIEEIYKDIADQASKFDKSLIQRVGAEKAKTLKSLDQIEAKVKKAAKSKVETHLNRVQKLKLSLFPSGLQERKENILQFITDQNPKLLQALLPHFDPFSKVFKVFMLQPENYENG